MSLSHTTATPSGSKQGGTTAGGKPEKYHNHITDSVMKSVQDEVKLLRSENEFLHDHVETLEGDVKTLEGDVKMLKGDFKTLLKSKDDPSVINGTAFKSNPTHEANGNATAVEGTTASKKKKKTKMKKKKGNKVASYWGTAGGSLTKIASGASVAKITVGLMSIALLVSITVGQGIISKNSPLVWEKKSGEMNSPRKLNKVVDSANEMGNAGVLPVKVSVSNNQVGQEEISQSNTPGKMDEIMAHSAKMSEDEVPLVTEVSVTEDQDRQKVIGKTSASLRKQKSRQSNTPGNFNKVVDSTKMRGEEAPSAKKILSKDQVGQGVTDKISSSLHKQKSRKTSIRERLKKIVDSAKMHGEKAPSTKAKASMPKDMKNEPSFRILQETIAPSYYLDLTSGFCDNDPSRQPEPSDGMVLYETAEECCEVEFSSQDNSWIASLCMKNSPSLPGTTGTVVRNIFSSTESSPPTTLSLPMPSNPASPIVTPTTATDTPTLEPTTSTLLPNLSTGYVCDADPETCGCPNLFGSDYRGSISTTMSGLPCERWDAFELDYPNAGLEENFCRNLDNDPSGPWCFTTDDADYCDVPTCGAPTASPTASALPSSSPTQRCPVADKETCGCEVLRQEDYRGSVSKTAEDLRCQRWDQLEETDVFYALEDNFCRNPDYDVGGPWCYTNYLDKDWTQCDIPKCDPCSCMPPCGQTNNEACACPSALQAEECCKEEGASCECRYLKDACRISLENNTTDFCDDAEVACCEGKGNPNCKCNMYEQICSENPSLSTCVAAAYSCCTLEGDSFCECDFYTYTANSLRNSLSYGSGNQSFYCDAAVTFQTTTSPSAEKDILKQFYNETGGEDWFKHTGWLDDEIPHCQWFGLTCDADDLLIEINLRNNNLARENPFSSIIRFPQLTKLDLAENKLSGIAVSAAELISLRNMVHIDISENEFSGHADMTFSPATVYVNFSQNNFTSASFKRFNAAYETLRVVDLSNNLIDQDASEIFLNIPPNLEELFLFNNAMRGALPNPFPIENIRHFAIAHNNINGPLPDFPTLQLRELDLSNQKQTGVGGLTGRIPAALFGLADLSLLDLAGNKLTQGIPSAIGNLAQLKVLNISSNLLTRSIPSELGKLKGVLEVLDLSTNKLMGSIPQEVASLERALVHLSGNSDILNPAPLNLCFLPGFDLMNDSRLCPPERNALKEFHESAKGGEWTESSTWLDPYKSHCLWYGVECSETNNTIELKLPNNGLSGTLSKKIASLSLLEVLDLSDNDIKGSIPTEIGLLSHLIYLRLRYNSFIGNETNFGNLQHLELIQLHGNRLSGSIPKLNLTFSDPSSFVTDCGNPSDFDEALGCEECTMCCNAQGDCTPTEDRNIQKVGFKNYTQFTVVVFGFLFIASCGLALMVFVYGRRQNRNLPISTTPESSLLDRDNKYALDGFGEDSVYQFLLGTSKMGWAVVLAVIGVQIWMLFVFVRGAEIDWTDDKSDFVYTWQCPRDQDGCENKSDLTLQGWAVFAILMIAYLLKDIISGTKLIVLSTKERHNSHTRTRFFFGGWLLNTVTCFTLFVSAIYNAAIATSDTEIIMNSVVILFICDIDECLYDILMILNPSWVETLSGQQEEQDKSVVETSTHEKNDEEDGLETASQHETNQNLEKQDQSGAVKDLEGEVQSLKTVVQTLQEAMKQQNAKLERFLTMPQDDRARESESIVTLNIV